MATYAEKKYNAVDYSKFRPTYPTRFFKDIIKYHKEGPNAEFDKFLDVGCGPGEATFELSQFFKSTTGTDPSNVMITTANSFMPEKRKEFGLSEDQTLEFKIGTAESNPFIPDGSVDLLTGAECIHWVDHAKFIDESHRVLKKSGTLGYWLYHESIFQGPQGRIANEIYNKFLYDDDRYMGQHWDTGKTHFRQFLSVCNNILVESGKFEDIRTVIFNQAKLSDEEKQKAIARSSEETPIDGPYKNGEYPILYIKRDMTLNDFMNFIKTHSALHRWYAAKPEIVKGSEDDLVEIMRKEFHDKCGWHDETDIQIIWDSVYVLARKI